MPPDPPDGKHGIGYAMGPVTLPDPELDRYFVLLAAFESGIPTSQNMAPRLYASFLLHAYLRYSWFKASTPGKPALCMTNIIVTDSALGLEHFARFISRFLAGGEGLNARVIYLENIVSAALRCWLVRAGFQRCAYGTGEFPSYFLERLSDRQEGTPSAPAQAGAQRRPP